MTDGERCVFNILGANWQKLVDVVCAEDFSSKLGSHYDVVLFSFFRLWNRAIKRCTGRRELVNCFSDSSCDVITGSTGVLVDMLKSGGIPALCHGKCLAVVMQSVWVDPGATTAVPACQLHAAEIFVGVFYSNDCSWSLKCCEAAGICCTSVGRSYSSDVLCSCSQNCAAATAKNETETLVNSKPLIADEQCHTVSMTDTGSAVIVDNQCHIVSTKATCDTESCKMLTVSYGLCSLLSRRPEACSVISNRHHVSYNAKLLRKFTLLVLRALDVIANKSFVQGKPYAADLFSIQFALELHLKH